MEIKWEYIGAVDIDLYLAEISFITVEIKHFKRNIFPCHKFTIKFMVSDPVIETLRDPGELIPQWTTIDKAKDAALKRLGELIEPLDASKARIEELERKFKMGERDPLDYENIASDRKIYLAQRDRLQIELNAATKRIDRLKDDCSARSLQYHRAIDQANLLEGKLAVATRILGQQVIDKMELKRMDSNDQLPAESPRGRDVGNLLFYTGAIHACLGSDNPQLKVWLAKRGFTQWDELFSLVQKLAEAFQNEGRDG